VAALAVAFLQPFGLVGACCAVAVPGALCRGVGQVLLGCRLVGLPVSRYLLQTFVPALACALLPAAALWLAVTWSVPMTWARLVGYGTAYTLLFAACSAFLLGQAVLRRVTSRALGRAPAVGGEAARPARAEKSTVPAEA
jgi:hypothetical protein